MAAEAEEELRGDLFTGCIDMDEGFNNWLKTEKGFPVGHEFQDKEFKILQAEYQKRQTGWQTRILPDGQLIRENPQTGLAMQMTNSAGASVRDGVDVGAAVEAANAGRPQLGGTPGATPAPTPASSGGIGGWAASLFGGVSAKPSPTPAAVQATNGNPVMPVNVNPAAPQAARAQAATAFRSENDVIAAARAGQLSKAQAHEILVKQFGFDP